MTNVTNSGPTDATGTSATPKREARVEVTWAGEHRFDAGRPGGPTLRLHIGLENVDDLKADLERGFAALNAAV